MECSTIAARQAVPYRVADLTQWSQQERSKYARSCDYVVVHVRQRPALFLLGMSAVAGTIAASMPELNLGTRIAIGVVAALLSGSSAAASLPWKATRVERSHAKHPTYSRFRPNVRFAAALGFAMLVIILAPEMPHGPKAWMTVN